jgi:transposase
MRGKVAIALPADFAECMGLTYAEIEARYSVSSHPVRRWIKEMPADWRAQHKALIAERSRQAVKANLVKAIAARLAKPRLVVVRDGRCKPTPPSILADLCAMTIRQVAAKHGVARGTAGRWAAELSDDDRRVWLAAAEARRIKPAREVRKQRVAERRAEKPPKVKRPRRVKNRGYGKPVDVPSLSGGVIAQAAQHLRRVGFIPVVRGDVLTRELRGYYVVGALRLREAEMVDLARAKGFDQDAWQRVPA